MVTISESVTHIGYWAFYDCRNLMDAGFNNATGWNCTPKEAVTGDDTISIKADDLIDYYKAARYLYKDYVDYYWKRAIT